MTKAVKTNVVDSSGWLEYFADGTGASFFAAAIEDIDNLVVPVVSIYEVFKKDFETGAKTTPCAPPA